MVLKLLKWQEKAWKAWNDSGRRGTIAASTGSGKTHIGLKLLEAYPSSTSLIVVPTIFLCEQWFERIEQHLGMRVGRVGGSHHDINCRIIIAVVNSIREIPNIKRDILILDEVHRYGSTVNRKFIKQGWFSAILGLSATPKNEDEEKNKIIEYYAPIVYEYNLKDAIKDRVISKYSINFVETKLKRSERIQYTRIQNYINAKRPWRFGGNFAQLPFYLKKAYADRKNIANNAVNKIKLVDAIVKRHSKHKIIVFTESIAQANAISETVDEPHAVYHTGVKHRDIQLEKFRNDEVRVLIACRCIDEGMDIPEASVGIIASGNKVGRQQIQRLGRIVRKQEGKHSRLYILYARQTTENSDAIKKKELLKEGATKINWIKQSQILGK